MRFAGLLICVAAAARGASPAAPPDIEAQYLTAVAQLKNPAATGILVTEVDPDSATADTDLRAGDIITEYGGTHVATLHALRAQVADMIAQRVIDDAAGTKILARVRRGDKELLLSLPRAALGIRAVAVEAGVARDRPTPPDRPGDLALDWTGVLKALNEDNAAAHGGTARTAFRMFERIEPADAAPATPAPATQPATTQSILQALTTQPQGPEETWVGWQVWTAESNGKELSGHSDIHHLVLSETGPAALSTEPSAAGFRLRDLGDYKTSAAYQLADASSMYLGADDLFVNATAVRQADRLKVAVQLSTQPVPPDGAGFNEQQAVDAPRDAIPQCAIPWFAAALPQKPDAAIGLHLLTVRKFVPRPGYVLVTRGRAAIPDDLADKPATQPAANTQPWRVDLMHCGVIVESYWFTDQRRLLEVESAGVPEIILRRVSSEKEASTPLIRGSAAAPANTPTTVPETVPPPTPAP